MSPSFWGGVRDVWASNMFLHKGKKKGDNFWRTSPVRGTGTHLTNWPEVPWVSPLTRCSDPGCCGKTVEGYQDFELSPPVALPCGHLWYCQGDAEPTRSDHRGLGLGWSLWGTKWFSLWRSKAWEGVNGSCKSTPAWLWSCFFERDLAFAFMETSEDWWLLGKYVIHSTMQKKHLCQ